MATCSKRKVSFFIRDILCAATESPNHVTSSNHVTSANAEVAGRTLTLTQSEVTKKQPIGTTLGKGTQRDVIINDKTSSCHPNNMIISRNNSTDKKTVSNHISNGECNKDKSVHNEVNDIGKDISDSAIRKTSSKTTRRNNDNNVINNNNNNNITSKANSISNIKDNAMSKINNANFKVNSNVNVSPSQFHCQQQQQQQQQQKQLQQKQQQLPQVPVPIPLVPRHPWPHTSAQRLPLLPTSGTGESPYLYTSAPLSGRGSGLLVPAAARSTTGLPALSMPCSLPPVPGVCGGAAGGYRGYGGGQGGAGHHCGVYRCNCGTRDTTPALNHPGLQYLGGPVSYPAYPPPISRPSIPVPIPLPVYLRTRASPNGDGNCRPRKCRRSRTVFSELQLMGLERRFDDQKYLSTPDRGELARTLGLTQVQVKTWYQNRRMKWKKQVLQGGATEAPTKPKGRPRKEQQPAVTMDTTTSTTANQNSDEPEVTCHDECDINMTSTGEHDGHCETGSDSDDEDDVTHDVESDIDSDIGSDVDIQIT